ncbi:primase-helicase family protein [Falsihalocynthiibacter sp. BN13B15]|uniref:primase-helicase family protein n=1 Tax=Falsihalocynthiibacter sp. BN13B15 TaxID=3240871 RepID=UPI00350EA62E
MTNSKPASADSEKRIPVDDVLESFSDDDVVVDPDLMPDLTEWQEVVMNRLETDLQSGVAWQVSATDKIAPRKPASEDLQKEVLMEVASWFLTADQKYIMVDKPDTRINSKDVAKIAKPKMVAHFHGLKPLAETARKKADDIITACVDGTPEDPRLSFGVWSGMTYAAPGNTSPRLYRNYMWDLNSWSEPSYRKIEGAIGGDYGALQPFLDFAIPDKDQQRMLLDWIAWSLKNEASKPSWAILLFSEEKGTGKSTIGVVLEALFGAANTAKIDGVDKLVATHNDRVLDKKLIVAEEVHISSQSKNGNAIKDLITGSGTTVNPKYQPTKTIPLKACFLFTTNHKPLWLEGGERRYYIIEMDHDGHAQGPRSDEFTVLVGDVFSQINNPKKLAALYTALKQRELSPNFDSKNMRFDENATPIMRELQEQSGRESDETLEAILAEHCVSIIPSSDFKDLVKYLNVRADNTARNALIRLGYESTRLRWGKGQQRAWVKKGLMVENGRIKSTDLAGKLDDAVDNGFEWFPLNYFMKATWDRLRDTKLKVKFNRDSETDATDGYSDGAEGPFLDSKSDNRYQTWLNDRDIREGNEQKFMKT